MSRVVGHRKINMKSNFIAIISFVLLFCGCVSNHITGEEPRECPVHHVELEKILVPVRYGRINSMSDEYFEAEKAQFPYAQTWVYGGGCVIGIKEILLPRPKEGVVMACPVCNKEKEFFLMEHDERE